MTPRPRFSSSIGGSVTMPVDVPPSQSAAHLVSYGDLHLCLSHLENSTRTIDFGSPTLFDAFCSDLTSLSDDYRSALRSGCQRGPL